MVSLVNLTTIPRSHQFDLWMVRLYINSIVMKELINLTTSANFNPNDIKRLTMVGLLILLLIPSIIFYNTKNFNTSNNYLGIFDSFKNLFSQTGEGSVPQTEVEPSVFSEALKPIYSAPTRVYADAVKIDANIIEVGVTESGAMDTPKEWLSAGWYKKSAKPGEPGNLIVNAHYDDSFARPAAFWELKNLKSGDKVYIVDGFGKTYTYQVTELLHIDISDPNRLHIFESDESKAHITLITCGGVWLPGEATYNKRVVVKGDLIES